MKRFRCIFSTLSNFYDWAFCAKIKLQLYKLYKLQLFLPKWKAFPQSKLHLLRQGERYLYFEDLFRFSGDISIHQRRINSLLTEVYKYIHGLSHQTMNEVFSTRANIYNAGQFNVSETHIPTSNRYGFNPIPYKPNQL